MTYSGELVMPTSYVEVAEEEMMYLDGGDAARQRMMADFRRRGTFKVTKKDRKTVYCYTLGYMSVAFYWCAPVSVALGVMATLYGIS